MDGLADGATLDRGRSRRYLRLWNYHQCLGDARAALRLGRVDDSGRLGCCRAVTPDGYALRVTILGPHRAELHYAIKQSAFPLAF
jgi:hypothetical protein